jgi:hypothetical protein
VRGREESALAGMQTLLPGSSIPWPVCVPCYLTLGTTALGLILWKEVVWIDSKWQNFVLVALITKVFVRVCFTDERRQSVKNLVLFEFREEYRKRVSTADFPDEETGERSSNRT